MVPAENFIQAKLKKKRKSKIKFKKIAKSCWATSRASLYTSLTQRGLQNKEVTDFS